MMRVRKRVLYERTDAGDVIGRTFSKGKAIAGYRQQQKLFSGAAESMRTEEEPIIRLRPALADGESEPLENRTSLNVTFDINGDIVESLEDRGMDAIEDLSPGQKLWLAAFILKDLQGIQPPWTNDPQQHEIQEHWLLRLNENTLAAAKFLMDRFEESGGDVVTGTYDICALGEYRYRASSGNSHAPSAPILHNTDAAESCSGVRTVKPVETSNVANPTDLLPQPSERAGTESGMLNPLDPFGSLLDEAFRRAETHSEEFWWAAQGLAHEVQPAEPAVSARPKRLRVGQE